MTTSEIILSVVGVVLLAGYLPLVYLWQRQINHERAEVKRLTNLALSRNTYEYRALNDASQGQNNQPNETESSEPEELEDASELVPLEQLSEDDISLLIDRHSHE